MESKSRLEGGNPVTPGPEESSVIIHTRKRRRLIGVLFVLFSLLTLSHSIDSVARNVLAKLAARRAPEPVVETSTTVTSTAKVSTSFSFKDLDLHPDLLFQPYTAGPLLSSSTTTNVGLIASFRNLLSLYEQRQAVDDNFTIRVVDNRTGELLELFVLEEERARYNPDSTMNWDRIDALRRVETRRLVEKYAKQGIPKADITVKWGRKNQVLEARRNEEAFIEYEVRLARYLGLSLLATEIGTVETFNQDRLVSTVGARSRYQMMPYLLRQRGIHHYQLNTAAGKKISVFEEWHPLLTMEPAMLTLRGYANAVGHEIPGISAYHTGPGNIYAVYRQFLSKGPASVKPGSNVVDAYVWAVTEGFDTVSKGTSFKQYSRGYVATAYGSLRATHDLPIDTSLSMKAERVQVRQGAAIYLSRLLNALGKHRDRLVLPAKSGDATLYEIFREMNPHMVLPEGLGDAGVPTTGDVRLVAEVDGMPVRIFLPLGASSALEAEGLDVLDPSATFRFDHDTFRTPNRSERTFWDDEYDRLVQDIKNFGFTSENRLKLIQLKARFEELAEANPTHFRLTQRDIIRTHTDVWRTGVWEKLASATSAARGELRAPVLPPEAL